MDLPEEHVRLLAHIRGEMRFEVGVLHDRINALISAEAFLTISFTMALANSDAHAGANIFDAIAPMLSVIGFILAVLAWPGVNTGFKILIEWNTMLLQALHAGARGVAIHVAAPPSSRTTVGAPGSSIAAVCCSPEPFPSSSPSPGRC